jgi:hypothetical protein
MSASQQARNKVLAVTLDRERHEFARREMALCQEIERLRKLCAGRPRDPFGGVDFAGWQRHWKAKSKWDAQIDAAGRGDGVEQVLKGEIK